MKSAHLLFPIPSVQIILYPEPFLSHWPGFPLLHTRQFSLLEEVVEGGPFTRDDPATGERSCLSLYIVSEELKPYVKSLYIDSARTMGVARPVWDKGKFRLVHSDHFPCLLTLQGLHWKEKRVKQELS